MKCGLCGTEKGLIMKIELYKDGVKFDAGIISDTIVICESCLFKMLYNECEEKKEGFVETMEYFFDRQVPN